jgi:hypothetical protein
VKSVTAINAASLPSFRAGVLGRADLRGLALLVVGFASVLLLVPPVRSYPIVDDWIYASSVADMLSFDYKPHDWSQAAALGHIAWGALLSALFGQSFTVLSIANLLMSAACLLLFYLLARQLGIDPVPALFGSALLGLNPLYFFLSYSFMTDVAFLAYLLAACLCYVRGVQGYGEGWLWAGSVAAALACLTRQQGILLVPVVLFYLWWSRRWTWRGGMAVAAIPALALVGYTLWKSSFPTSLAALWVAGSRQWVIHHPMEYAGDHMMRIVWALSILGLCLVPILRIPRRPAFALPVFAVLAVFLAESWLSYGTLMPITGNVIDFTGFYMDDYHTAPVWNQRVWAILSTGGALTISLITAAYIDRVWSWFRARPWRQRTDDPALVIYLLGIAMAVVALFLTILVFDRYFLPVGAVIILASLRYENSSWGAGRALLGWSRWLLLLPLAVFTLLSTRDYMDHAAARWQGAEQLVARGAKPHQVNAGFEWQGWYLFDEAARRYRQQSDLKDAMFPTSILLDPVYLVSDRPVDGYSEVGSLPYSSWLEGGQSRRVLLLKRN